MTETKNKERDPYTLDEEVALLQRFDERNVPVHYKVFFMLLMYLGLRKGEALAIEWKDIDIQSRTVFIHRNSQYQNASTGIYTTAPKTKGSIRNLRLPQEIIDLLPQLKEEQEKTMLTVGDNWVEYDRLFTTWNGEPMRLNRPYSWLKKFCERENLPFKAYTDSVTRWLPIWFTQTPMLRLYRVSSVIPIPTSRSEFTHTKSKKRQPPDATQCQISFRRQKKKRFFTITPK